MLSNQLAGQRLGEEISRHGASGTVVNCDGVELGHLIPDPEIGYWDVFHPAVVHSILGYLNCGLVVNEGRRGRGLSKVYTVWG